MRDRLLAVIYLASVLAVSMNQDVSVLGVFCALVLLACGRQITRLARRALLATAFFTGLVSLAWLATSLLEGTVPVMGLIRLNLRVFTLTTMTFLVASRLDILQITAFWPRFRTLIVLILAQIGVFRRLLGNLRLAAKSRTWRRPALKDSLGMGAATGVAILRRAEYAAEQMTQGMISRGFFLDPDRKSEPRS
ncbi:MAG: hypothetical protein KOO60_01935 [Gemmatimonadales bacterium]|nr:hypothetical protein [Gemmatimonadales bacterium]